MVIEVHSLGWSHSFYTQSVKKMAVYGASVLFKALMKVDGEPELNESDLELGKWLIAQSHSCCLDICLLVIVSN